MHPKSLNSGAYNGNLVTHVKMFSLPRSAFEHWGGREGGCSSVASVWGVYIV